MRVELPVPPLSVNSVISMRSPLSVARRRPSRRSSPSTGARSASLSAPSVPFQRGTARLPDSVAPASSVPAMRQPGGASIDHTPRFGSAALMVPPSGASGAHCQPPARCCTRVLMSASILPARSLSHASTACTASPSASSRSSAWRRPAGVLGASPFLEAEFIVRSLAVPVPVLVMRVTSAASPACTRMSPLWRADAGLGAQRVAGVDVPVAVEHQVAADAVFAQRGIGAERAGPGHRQALQLALGLHAEHAVGRRAALAEAQRLPVDAHGAGHRAAQGGRGGGCFDVEAGCIAAGGADGCGDFAAQLQHPRVAGAGAVLCLQLQAGQRRAPLAGAGDAAAGAGVDVELLRAGGGFALQRERGLCEAAFEIGAQVAQLHGGCRAAGCGRGQAQVEPRHAEHGLEAGLGAALRGRVGVLQPALDGLPAALPAGVELRRALCAGVREYAGQSRQALHPALHDVGIVDADLDVAATRRRCNAAIDLRAAARQH